MTETEVDLFELSIATSGNKKSKRTRLKPIKIVLACRGTETIEATQCVDDINGTNPINQIENFDAHDFELRDDDLEREFNDSLAFYENTHEEQDISFTMFQRKLQEEERQKKLAALDAYDMETRKEIETVISELCKEKQAATDRSLQKYKQRAVLEEKQNIQQQQDIYRQRVASNARQINERILQLQQRHQNDLNQALAHHQQQSRQRRLTEQMSAQEWHTTSQQIKAKQNQELESFRKKGVELNNSAEAEFQRDQEKIHKHHLHQMQEIESSRQKLHTKVYQQYQQIRQRYLKRHLQKVMKEKEELLSQGPVIIPASPNNENAGSISSALAAAFKSSREMAKSTMEEKAELNPPAPIRSAEPWAENLPQVAGGAARHKHRKSVLSQTVRQLNLEIHNEGLWLAPCPVDSENDSKKNDSLKVSTLSYEFIPWGVRAYQILDAVVSGEIPTGTCERILEKHPNAMELMSVQAGQVRCVVSDLRTSEETASLQRSAAVIDHQENELKVLEQNVTDTHKFSTDAEVAYTRAIQEEKDQSLALAKAEESVKKATKSQDDFKLKFKSFLGQDGKPLPEASLHDQQELSKAMSRHTNNHDAAMQQVSLAKQRLSECKEKVQNLHNIVKNAQKNYSCAVTILQKKIAMSSGTALSKSGRSSRHTSTVDEDDRAAFRVKDIIGALRVTADRRRDQSDQKKNTGFSSAWVQSFPGLPSSLKKSLWHKMHRRKQQVILRPTPESLVSDLRTNVAILTAAQCNDRDKMEKIEAEMMRAEQLYLLATHPLSTDTSPCVPPTKSSENWSEPGWKLNLSVPNYDAVRAGMILPCAPSFPVLENNLAEIASTPGRQAASLLRTSHFRCLSSPLSAFAVASSPAESNASLSQNRTRSEGDPLYITDEEITMGYNFAAKKLPPPTKSAPPRRRNSTPKSQLGVDSSHGENSSTGKRSSLSGASTASVSKATEITAAPGAAERKKSESKRQRGSTKSLDQASKKTKNESTSTPANSIPPQQFSPIVQKQQVQLQQHLQAPPQSPSSQRPSSQTHHQQRQHVSQQQNQTLSAQQQRQMRHQGSRHTQGQHQQQLSTSQHHQQMSSSQHHAQHLTQPHPSQHQLAAQQPFTSPQMTQMRMMQQQNQQIQNMSPRHQQVTAAYQPQAIQQMQQFYAPLNHPQAPIHMQGRSIPPPPPPLQQHPIPSLQQQQHQQAQPQLGVTNSGQSRKSDDSNDVHDPLFMLK